MKFMNEIKEKDIFPHSEVKAKCYTVRRVANAVLLNDKSEIAFLFASKVGYHTLPGGKVEFDETLEAALKREIIEEVGCEVKIKNKIGVIIQYEEKLGVIQISYFFITTVDGKIGVPKFTKGEKADGFKLQWVKIDDALKIIKKDKTNDYIGKFILTREKIVLEEAKKMLFNT